MKTKNITKTFEEAAGILENLGFKQETSYSPKSEVSIIRFKYGSYFAFVHRQKKNLFVITYLKKGDVKRTPKFGAKPGPKPSSDKKRKIVVFIEESKITKLGGDAVVRQLFYETATEAASMIGGVSGMVDESGSLGEGREVIVEEDKK